MNILYVEDEIAHFELTQRTLEDNLQDKFVLYHVDTLRGALKMLDMIPDIDLVLTDLRLPDGSGLDLLEKVKRLQHPPAVILVTGQGDQQVAVTALKAGAADYLVKEGDYLHRLPAALTNAIAQNRLAREQAALRAAEQRFRVLVEQLPAAVYTDNDDEYSSALYISPQIQEISGYSPEEWLANPRFWLERIHPDDLEAVQAELKATHDSHHDFNMEYRIIHRDGRVVWLKDYAKAILGEDGKPKYWQGLLFDITKTVETQEILQASEERFRRIFHSTPIATCVVTVSEGRFIDANQAFQDLTGRPLEILLGKTSLELGFWAEQRDRDQFIESLLKQGKGHGIETRFADTPNGSRDTLAFYEFIQLGGENCLLSMFYDVTEQIRSRKALEQQVKELTALHDVARAEAESFTEDEIIEKVTSAIYQIYSEVCGILILDASGTILTPHPSYKGADVSNWLTGYPIATGITGRSVRTGKIVRVGNITKEPDYIEIASRIRSEICVPVRIHDRIIGVINVESRQTDAYTEHDEDFLTTVASGLGNTLERLRLFDREQKRVRELDTLYQATRSLTESLDPATIAEKLIKILDELLGYEAASVHLYNQQAQTISTLAFNRKSHDPEKLLVDIKTLNSQPRRPGHGIIDWVIQHGAMVRSGDVSSDPRYFPILRNVRSELCVPLISSGNVIGALNIESTQLNAYTEEDERLISALANSAAIALENAQLYEVESNRRAEAESLREATAALGTSIELGTLLVAALDSLEKIIPYNSASILLKHGDDQMEIMAGKGFLKPEKVVGKIISNIGNWIKLALSRQTLIMEDAQTEPLFEKWEDSENIRGWMGVPMIARDEVIGFINLDSHRPNAFTQRQATLAQTFANSVAVAIQNAYLFESEKRRRQEAENLRQAATIMSSTLDLDAIVNEILKALKQVIPFDNGSVFFHEGDHLRIAMAQGYPHASQLINLTFPADDELFKEMMATRLPITIEDVHTDQRFKNWGDTTQTRGWMAIPLVARGNVLGYISLDSTKKAAFNEAVSEMAMAFANQAAAAIDNARLYDETQRRLREVEIINRVSTSLRSAQSLEEILPILLDEALHLMDTPHGSIWLYDQNNNMLHQRIAEGADANLNYRALSPVDGIVGHVFISGERYVSAELRNDLLLFEGNKESIPPGLGGICIPIKSTGGPVGVMMIAYDMKRRITDEINLLTIMAEITGNAIHRAELFEHSQEQVHKLTTLRDIDSAIASSTDLRVTLTILMDHTLRHLRADAMDILLYHPELQTLTYLTSAGFRNPSPSRPLMRLGEGLAGQVVMNGGIVQVADLPGSNEMKRDPMLAREGFISYFGVPLIVKGQTKGVFEIFHRASFSPTPDWTQFLHTLAGQAAIAIDNSQLFDNLQRSNQEIRQAYDTTLEGWARALELRDRETEGHTRRVTELTMQLAHHMGVTGDDLINIYRGVLLHDIGKMGVPDQILRKTGPLNESEWSEMRKHPEYAFNLLAPIPYLRPALDIPYCHHEHWDGSGYPRGLKGEQIPLAARIFSIVDIWDALLSDRIYRKAWPRDKVLEYLKEVSGKILDPRIVVEFLKMIEQGE